MRLQPRPTQGPATEALQMREIMLREAIAKMQAQRPILERQTRSASDAARASAENQILHNDLEIASAQAELTSVQQQLTNRRIGQDGGFGRGFPGQQPGRRPSLVDRIDNDAITGVFVMTTLAILIPLSVGITRRLWRRPAKDAPTAPAMEAIANRLERLEHAMDTVAVEIERVSESQRFVAKVLVERPSAAPAQRSPEADPALGEAKPFLALGAGPIEPIPVAQRQAVKQSVTPH